MSENTINELLDRFDETQDDKVVDSIIKWYLHQQELKSSGVKPKRRDQEDVDMDTIMRAINVRLGSQPKAPTKAFKRRI